jgi:hypothetical protein
MASYPKMFRIFIMKQVSGWCGSNSKHSLWDTSISNICPNCGLVRETSKHLTQCKHVGHVQLFHESTQEVITCLENANMDPILIDIIESYLLGQGTVTMESCVPLQSSYLQMSQSQDQLRWDCFVEGCISVLLLECIRPLFVQWTPQKSLEKWGIQILKALLNLTHKQWIFRNTDVHYKIDGLTQEQHWRFSHAYKAKWRLLCWAYFHAIVLSLTITFTILETRRQSNDRYGLHQWSPHSKPHLMPLPAR